MTVVLESLSLGGIISTCERQGLEAMRMICNRILADSCVCLQPEASPYHLTVCAQERLLLSDLTALFIYSFGLSPHSHLLWPLSFNSC